MARSPRWGAGSLYLEQGRTGEVKTLAEEMFWIFNAQSVRTCHEMPFYCTLFLW